jgi:hypothetical protein
MEREALETIHFQPVQQYPNIQECCYSEAAKACIQVLDTNIISTSLLLQNTEEWAGEVHTLGSQSLERREEHWELILQKYMPPEAQQPHQKSHQKTNVTTSISWPACNEPSLFT